MAEQTEGEVQLKQLYYSTHLLKEANEALSVLQRKDNDNREYRTHLTGMLEWIKENFGDVDTSDFGNKNLAEYIDECLEMEKELLEKINKP